MKSLRFVLAYVRHNLMTTMAYRSAFWMQVLGMMLNNVMLLFFWSVLFSRFPSMRGWDLRGVAILYAMVALGFGLALVCCGNCARIATLAANGALDYYLVLPADPLLHVLVSRTVLPAWGDALFGLAVYLVAAPQPWRHLPLFLLLSILSAVIFVAFDVLAESLVFWLGQASDLAMQLRNALLTFGLYPVDIFPGVVRVLLYTLIPAAFVGSVPAQLVIDFRWQQLAVMGAVAVGLAALARWVFYRGLRRYTSGNRIVALG